MRRLTIRIGDILVGELWKDDQQYFGFHWDSSYLNHPQRPVLGQWFEDRLEARYRPSRTLHPWFQNLLPERETTMRRELSRASGVDSEDEFGLLELLGDQLSGNVFIQPSTNRSTLPQLNITSDPNDRTTGFRASLGGMQLKMTLSGSSKLVMGVKENEIQWILKLAVAPEYATLPFNESAVMTWCKAAGFTVPDVRVIHRDELPDLGDIPASITHGFLIKRYDRTPQGRVHQEDFAQVFSCNPSQKYNRTDATGLGFHVGQILGEEGSIEFIRRLVTVIATGNQDAHLKNWSLIYPDGQKASFSPLYDQVSTIEYPNLDVRPALSIGTAKHFHQVDLAHLLAIQKRWKATSRPSDTWVNLKVRSIVEQTLDQLSKSFQPEALGMSPFLAKRIREHWTKVPLLRPHSLSR